MPQPGEKVISIGYPVFSLTQAQNVTDGIISSPYGMEGDLLHMQVTAPIQPGNSGGPVLDAHGRQVAVVVAKPSEAARSSRSIENVAWVIRGEVAIDFLERYGIRFIRDRGSRAAMTTAEVAAGHRQQALGGDQGAVDRVLRIMDRRAKYLGLDNAPRNEGAEQVATLLEQLLTQAPDGTERETT